MLINSNLGDDYITIIIADDQGVHTYLTACTLFAGTLLGGVHCCDIKMETRYTL